MPARGMIRSMQFVDKDNCLSRDARDARKKFTRGAQINKGMTCPRPKIYRRSTKKLGLLARERKIARGLRPDSKWEAMSVAVWNSLPLQPREPGLQSNMLQEVPNIPALTGYQMLRRFFYSYTL